MLCGTENRPPGRGKKVGKDLEDEQVEWITMATVTSDGLRYYRDIRFSEEAENLSKWLKENKIELAKWE